MESTAIKPGQQLFDIHAAVLFLRSIGAIGATENFVRGLINSGQIPHIRIGKKFYVGKHAIETWLTKHERRTG